MRFLFAFLLLVGSAQAVEPIAKIEAPTSIPAGAGIILDASASMFEPGVPVEWELLDGPKTAISTFDKGVNQSVVAYLRHPDPGRYRVRLTCYGLVKKTIGATTYDLLKASIADAVIDVGSTPAPAPPPSPTPTPKPQPTTELESLGLTFGRVLTETYATTLEESIAMVAAGQRIDLVAPDFAARWQARRDQASGPIRSAYGKILPEGTEPTDEQKAGILRAWQEVARGVRAASR